MMDYGGGLLLICAGLFAIAELIQIGYNYVQAHRAQEQVRAEKMRSEFAELRKQLIADVFNGKVQPDSGLFRVLYQIHTVIMRRPDQYALIAHNVAMVMQEEMASQRKNKRRITQVEKEHVTRCAFGLAQMMVNYIMPLRVTVRVLDYVNKSRVLRPIAEFVLEHLQRYFQKHDPAYSELKKGQESLEALAAA
ncbi:MAG: hypothetical protein HS115_00030 [Spirochaetales bacterium]|nr:hypothetical protein [Spirochaetales bacterium]